MNRRLNEIYGDWEESWQSQRIQISFITVKVMFISLGTIWNISWILLLLIMSKRSCPPPTPFNNDLQSSFKMSLWKIRLYNSKRILFLCGNTVLIIVVGKRNIREKVKILYQNQICQVVEALFEVFYSQLKNHSPSSLLYLNKLLI